LSGDDVQVDSRGSNATISCIGNDNIVKAKKGSLITLSAELIFDLSNGCYYPKYTKTEYVDGEDIKEDTWYQLIEGKFKEVDIWKD
jgi:hypothetical protein